VHVFEELNSRLTILPDPWLLLLLSSSPLLCDSPSLL
jgi:hypothetical protein